MTCCWLLLPIFLFALLLSFLVKILILYNLYYAFYMIILCSCVLYNSCIYITLLIYGLFSFSLTNLTTQACLGVLVVEQAFCSFPPCLIFLCLSTGCHFQCQSLFITLNTACRLCSVNSSHPNKPTGGHILQVEWRKH